MKRQFLTVICIFSIGVILACPESVTSGVRQGIRLNLSAVIPALLPFMVLTNIMIRYQLCDSVSFFFYPILSKIFRISTTGCFAVIIGFTCGYPMGAKIIGDLRQGGQISASEARYLITFCNNCSISFLLNYIFLHCLDTSMPFYAVLFLVYFPPVFTGILNGFLLKPDLQDTDRICVALKRFNPLWNTVKSLSILSVYIICFTVVSQWIFSQTFLPDTLKYILAGLMEITSGSDFIAKTASFSPVVKNVIILLFTVFGGFSIMFQSFEQLPDKMLKKYYILGKLEQLVIFSICICILYLLGK